MNKPIVGITMGDPAGSGPEITIKALADPEQYSYCRPIVVGDVKVMEQAKKFVGREDIVIHRCEKVSDALFTPGTIDVLHLDLIEDINKFEMAKVSVEGGNAAFQCVKKVIELAMAGEVDATCTNALNKEAMNKEVMALYKTYGVNPASGCLPLLIQMPVFFGLYQALLTSIELRHADFITYLPFTDKLWLVDLSARDPFYITPIIMGITMLLQQRLTPQAMDPRQQKIMMVLPIVFTFLFLAFPSGLVIYWLCNNVISIGQQWWMLHKGSKKKHAKAR